MTAPKLADFAVTSAKLIPGALNSTGVQPKSIEAFQIGALLNSDEIANGTSDL